MHGLVAYTDDSASETEETIPSRSMSVLPKDDNGHMLKHSSRDISEYDERGLLRTKGQSDAATSKAAHNSLNAADQRTSTNAESENILRTLPIAGTSRATSPSPSYTSSERHVNELSLIRSLLHPPPVTGLDDWGIPPAPDEEECEPVLVSKLSQFHELKRDPINPRHFNDSLMSNRSFRNPHLYAQLVDFVDVDERTTNFPPDIWDPSDVKEEWYAERIAEEQKRHEERQAAKQAAGKRSQIDFTSSSSRSTHDLVGHSIGSAANNSAANKYDTGRYNSGHSSKRGRFAPYSSGSNVMGRGRPGTRWA